MRRRDFLSEVDESYTPWQFAFFRIALGCYLVWHFLVLLPHAGEVFGPSGVMGDPSLNFTHPLFPWNPLGWEGLPWLAEAWVLGCLGLSGGILLGWRRPACSLILWFGWACLFNRNNLISNPSIPYIGLLLLLLAIIPDGEPMRLRGKQGGEKWKMPAMAVGVVWALLACGYTFSGIDKLASPSWLDGRAISLLMDNPLARPGALRDSVMSLPEWTLRLMTWGALAAEILFLPLCLSRGGRLVAWASMLAMHLGIMALVSFADLSLGMVMAHLFTFDRTWARTVGEWMGRLRRAVRVGGAANKAMAKAELDRPATVS